MNRLPAAPHLSRYPGGASSPGTDPASVWAPSSGVSPRPPRSKFRWRAVGVLPAGRPALDGARAADELAAAAWFPPVAGADVVHVHADPVTGLLAAEGELLPAEEFHSQVLVPRVLERGQSPRRLLVMVSCGLGAARPGQAESAARVLARLGDRPVLAASADVFTTRAGAVQVRETSFDLEGRPLLAGQQAGWRLYVPGGAEPVPFGPDLAAVLAGPELAAALPEGIPVPEAGQHPVPARCPAGDVRWAMGVEIEQHNVRLFWPSGGALQYRAQLVRSRDGLVRLSRTARGCGSASRAFCMTARRPWRRPGRCLIQIWRKLVARQRVGAGDCHGAVAGAG